MSNDPAIHEAAHLERPQRGRRGAAHVAAFGIAAFAVLAIGAVGGAAAMKFTRPSVDLAPLTPTSISSLKDDWSTVTVKGTVAEIYGNKFIVQDETGRALIETGPAGESGSIVAISEPVSVQGRFEHGFLHASYVVHQNGRTDALRPPPGPPPHGGPIGEALRELRR